MLTLVGSASLIAAGVSVYFQYAGLAAIFGFMAGSYAAWLYWLAERP
jgi:hypothetical protein